MVEQLVYIHQNFKFMVKLEKIVRDCKRLRKNFLL
jgi:hypothetical protein